MVKYKDLVGKLFAASNRDWLLHKPGELHIRSDGTLYSDLEGLTSEGDFYCNGYEPGVRMLTSLGCWPMFAYTQTLNSSLTYITEWNLPPGSMFNPQNPFAATVMGLTQISGYIYMFMNSFSRSFFARGYLEESFPSDNAGVGYGLAGVMSDGFRWAGGDMTLITSLASSATPFKDGEPAMVCTPNPAPDQGETELSEFLQPTNLNIGKSILPDYCGHGKFRGGLGTGMLQMITDPGRSLIMAVMGPAYGTGRGGMGMCGGYPGSNDIAVFAHDTNIREILAQGKPYPRDLIEMREWLRDGKLKAGHVETFQGATPSIPLKDGDLVGIASGSRGGWGDPLERQYSLIEEDVKYGWITPDVAKTVYGAVTDEKGKVKVTESDKLRQQMRNRRKAKSLDAKDWWKQERQTVLKKEWTEDVYNMFADALKWEKFRNEFMGMWQLPQDYQL
jgi:N-methylhydantoinase B/acetone carboxylase alpha subunit